MLAVSWCYSTVSTTAPTYWVGAVLLPPPATCPIDPCPAGDESRPHAGQRGPGPTPEPSPHNPYLQPVHLTPWLPRLCRATRAGRVPVARLAAANAAVMSAAARSFIRATAPDPNSGWEKGVSSSSSGGERLAALLCFDEMQVGRRQRKEAFSLLVHGSVLFALCWATEPLPQNASMSTDTHKTQCTLTQCTNAP